MARWLLATAVAVLALAACTSAQPFNLATGATVTTNISTLASSGQFVKVSWSGIPNPTFGDVVALYVQAPGTTVDTLSPLRFQWVNRSPGYQSGSGSITFQVLNQRYPVIFTYFSNISSNFVSNVYTSNKVIAVSSPIAVQPNEPTQGHLSFTNNTGEVVAQWTTRDAGTPVAQVGTVSGQYTQTAVAVSNTYTRAQMVGQPANTVGYFDPGQLHYATFIGLAPNTKYFYRYGDATLTLFSPEYSFTTPPVPSAAATVNFLAWADAGQAVADGTNEYDYYDDYDFENTSPYGSLDQVYASAFNTWQIEEGQQGASLQLTARLQNELATFQPTLAINNGDIAYARHAPSTAGPSKGFVTQWDVYFEQYKPIYTGVPVMTLPGNHERDAPATGDRFYPLQSRTDSGGEAGFPYELRLKMPTPTQREEWYSFNHGPIHFIQTSTEQPFGAGSPQWQFVVNDLQKVDRTVTPWVIVGFHRPIYTPSLEGVTLASDLQVATDLRNTWETIFFQYEVDMTWSGHVHVYERTCPVLYKTCLGYTADGIPNAPVHMAIGNGGYDLTWFINPTPAPYFDALALEHGYTRGTANATTLHITAISSETGKVIDDFVLKKAANYKPNLAARNAFLDSGFQSTYQPSFLEEPGLSPNTLFSNVFFNQLAANLKNATSLLQQLKNENNSLVVNTNGPPDNVPNLAQVFDVYKTLLQQPGFLQQNGIPNATIAAEFINAAFIPLFNRLDANALAQANSNGAIDAGIIVPAQAGELPSPTPTPSSTLVPLQKPNLFNLTGGPLGLGEVIQSILGGGKGVHSLFEAKDTGVDDTGAPLPEQRKHAQGRLGRL